jgi:SdpI/YfhL protein family
MSRMSNIGAGTIIFAFVLCGACLPLLLGKIGRNKWYGFRGPKAFESEENWEKINRYGAGCMMLWCLPIIIVGLIILLVPLEMTVRVPLSALPVAFIFAAIFQTGAYIKKL